MKDLIKERDEKEKMEHSIVKWWNVHYMTPEELRAAQQTEDRSAGMPAQPDRMSEDARELQIAEDDLHAAEAIIERLQQEAREDEARKRQEIEQAKQEAEANFNPTTGAYSGTYGTGEVNEEAGGQIQAILSEKDEALRDLIEQTGEE